MPAPVPRGDFLWRVQSSWTLTHSQTRKPASQSCFNRAPAPHEGARDPSHGSLSPRWVGLSLGRECAVPAAGGESLAPPW